VLYDEITGLLNDEERLASMRSMTKKLGIPDASTRILSVIDELV